MINFDALNFSECRSEEVISFFWRSVYFSIIDIRRKSMHVYECGMETNNTTQYPPKDFSFS